MTFGFIEAEKASFPISRMCHVLGVSQSGFFAWKERPACLRQQGALLRALRIAEGQGLEVLMVSYGQPSAAIRSVEAGWRTQRGIA